MITFTEVSALAVSVELVVTILKQRAPGMFPDRVPLFVWSMLVTSFMVILAMPAVMIASTLADPRQTGGTQFFNPAEGGDVLLWQHLFLVLRSPRSLHHISSCGRNGIDHRDDLTRRPVFGYLSMVMALVSTGVLAFGLWVHHSVRCRIATVRGELFHRFQHGDRRSCGIANILLAGDNLAGSACLQTPLLFVFGFISNLLVIGGMTGVDGRLGAVRHAGSRHVFRRGAFPLRARGRRGVSLLGAIYYWFPKFTGRTMSENLGRWVFALVFTDFISIFFPMHVLGLAGMLVAYTPTNPSLLEWSEPHDQPQRAGPGVRLSPVCDRCRSKRTGLVVWPNPWGALTLEWATAFRRRLQLRADPGRAFRRGPSGTMRNFVSPRAFVSIDASCSSGTVASSTPQARKVIAALIPFGCSSLPRGGRIHGSGLVDIHPVGGCVGLDPHRDCLDRLVLAKKGVSRTSFAKERVVCDVSTLVARKRSR